ncbi:hypothetical protein TTHERM_00723400 (macronuclear) [Tetrahymena thermophila SB210]|uniref:Uncharacterized protein n=1 Tax=Tetrahymena thermophila (strain SB210) TaxID=312017 RepID=I7M640_TETTS|nr:hypothetical protein TTHERM_00723400 [Tetrahymena thermophila SB210]EAR84155.2 hypothetical protein TTHERM_00723400 [Tetrahymena thermophila SB210]|eukprot:XP_001031818.2 hypothetical protein TTHERM_00723400 [Tetrahymena thermophila SB210]
MSQNPNLIKIQNNLSKEFQKWKFQREQNHQLVIDDIERSSLFFKFKDFQNNKNTKNATSSQKSLNNANLLSPKNNNPTKVFSSSLNNFRKTIIIDGIKDKNHVYNQLFNSQENLPFVPYINERDKLGRLVKDNEKSDVKINEVNIVNQISYNQRHLKFQKTIEIDSYEDSNQKSSFLPSQHIQDDQEIQKFNNQKENKSKHQKSLSYIPFSTQNNNSTNLPEKIRSSTFYSTISNKGQSSNKLNQLLKGIGSFQQISMVKIPEQSFQGKHTFININSLQQINMNDHHENINQNQNYSSLLGHKQSIPSLSQLNQNKSFTQLISYNSQPCSPSRFITKIQSNNNSVCCDEKILEVDKNKQFKCSQEEVVRKTEAFYKKYIDSKIKRENLEKKEEFPTKFKARVLPLKFPESAKASHACRILYNHSKKIEKFNKMIDRNDPNILNFEVDNKQKNTEKYKNAMESYKKRFSIAAGFNFQNNLKKNDERKQLKEQKRQQLLEKWGERVDSSELDDEEEKYRKKILNPILTKEQQIQKDRERKRQIFDEYEKWYTLQMYYIQSSDKDVQL